MTALPFRPGGVILRRQRTLAAQMLEAGGDHPGLRWRLGVAKAPDEVDTSEPIAAMTELRLHTGVRSLKVLQIAMISLPEATDRSRVVAEDMRGVVIRLFGPTLWRAATSVARQLAAIGEIDGVDLPADPPEWEEFPASPLQPGGDVDEPKREQNFRESSSSTDVKTI